MVVGPCPIYYQADGRVKGVGVWHGHEGIQYDQVGKESGTARRGAFPLRPFPLSDPGNGETGRSNGARQHAVSCFVGHESTRQTQ